MEFAFIWAYSLRAQYYNLGWLSAQNYIMGNSDKLNSLNIYRVITEADSPVALLSVLSDRVDPLPNKKIVAKKDNIEERDDEGVYQNYLYYFRDKKYMEGENDK